MSRVFLFAGTSEGRRLARRLGAAGITVTISVATEYGAELLSDSGLGESVTVLRGRMSRDEMEQAIREAAPEIVVDATHPYALAVSENIRNAAEAASVSCLRLLRKTKDSPSQKVFLFQNYGEVIQALRHTAGNILLTTGVNSLAEFAAEPELKDRLFVRVLPGSESITACEEAGIHGRQIIAMQGPFSREMNRATIHDFEIRHLVTKQSGRPGGFEEKVFAAQETGAALYIVGAPEEEGISYAEVLDRLGELLSVDLRETITISVSLVGVGPGEEAFLTEEARKAIREADVLFGAERHLAPYQGMKQLFPNYKGDEILPRLEQLLREARDKDPHVRAAVLLSGDSGFYSGSSGLIFYLTNWRRRMQLSETGRFAMQIRTIPGVSAIQLMAARLQEPWEKAYIDSLHGTDEDAWERVLHRIPKEKRTILLTSGAKDVRRLLKWIRGQGSHHSRYSLYAGYRLSYPEEQIYQEPGEIPGRGTEDLSAKSFPDILPEGLYTVMIHNSEPEEEKEDGVRQDTLGISNELFVREEGIPITKEEIRTVAISKLRITEPAVIFDIGSGSGSFACELGRILGNSRIFAIEKSKRRVELIERNVRQLKASSVSVVHGEAPDVLGKLVAPTHAVIGGSDGQLLPILQELYRISPGCRVVILAATLETKAEIAAILTNQVPMDFEPGDPEYIELNLSRSRMLGKYRSLRAENPVAICAFTFRRKPVA
ncbi:MAG: precorrin-6A reductase [Eubacterium sp.]|nr:precorrin-6A reductase [Eubacterium sp.]